MSYQLARQVHLMERDGEHFLVCKAPLCVLRLNRSLKDLLDRMMTGPLDPDTAAEAAVLEQLAAKGFALRTNTATTQTDQLPTVSIVIPVKDRADELQRCLASIASICYPQELLQLIVVDDGSSDRSAEVARLQGAKVIPSGGSGRGPAAARNVGARAATGDILAFIDSDCTATSGWLNELIPSFRDEATAAVGGLVDGMCTESVIDRYETVMSSLSLGSRERSGSSGDDTFYLPSCNLLVRRSAFLRAGGFKDEMHVGEDVDLTWRLRDSGWTITYLPAGRVFHEHRSSVRSFMSRRFDYGTSEGILQRIHPQRRKRMVVPPLLAVLLALLALSPVVGWWSLAAAVLLLTLDTFSVRRKMVRRGIPFGLPAIAAGRLRALGSLIYYLSFHLVRYYSLLLILAALLVPWLWLPFLGMLACSAGVDFSIKKPSQSFIAFAAIYTLEHIAYGSGVFWGCLRRGSFSSYRVVLMRRMELSTQV